MADALHYPRSSLHGLLRTLVEASWLEYDPHSHDYSLGIKVWEAGHTYLRAATLGDRALPHMQRVRDALDETVQLAILDGRYNLYVAKLEGNHSLRLNSQIGHRIEAHATGVGKMLLAGLLEEEVERRLGDQPLERFTPHTLADRDALRQDLARTRARGYAFDAEEHSLGVACVAIPVYDSTGSVVAAMSVSFPTVRFNDEIREKAITLLLEAARGVSADLGYMAADSRNPSASDNRQSEHTGKRSSIPAEAEREPVRHGDESTR